MRFAYSPANGAARHPATLPLLPLSLQYGNEVPLAVEGILDTGASVNVLPHRMGLDLGARWSELTPTVTLTGNLARFDARALLLTAIVGNFPPVPLAFAWTRGEETPLLLGQVNFFAEFDICFYRSQFAFDIRSKNTPITP